LTIYHSELFKRSDYLSNLFRKAKIDLRNVLSFSEFNDNRIDAILIDKIGFYESRGIKSDSKGNYITMEFLYLEIHWNHLDSEEQAAEVWLNNNANFYLSVNFIIIHLINTLTIIALKWILNTS
jgi:hypothetical protein